MPRKPLYLDLSKTDIIKLCDIINSEIANKNYLLRCNIIHMTHKGFELETIASMLGVSKTTANRWRQVFLTQKWDGIKLKKVGRPKLKKRCK